MQIIWSYFLIGSGLVVLLLLLAMQNRKDKRKFIDTLNQDYKKDEKHKDDNDPDDLKDS